MIWTLVLQNAVPSQICSLLLQRLQNLLTGQHFLMLSPPTAQILPCNYKKIRDFLVPAEKPRELGNSRIRRLKKRQ